MLNVAGDLGTADLDRWATRSVKIWLNNQAQCIVVNGLYCTTSAISGVPESSVLEGVNVTVITFADDTHLEEEAHM